jgi:hypothetical protein
VDNFVPLVDEALAISNDDTNTLGLVRVHGRMVDIIGLLCFKVWRLAIFSTTVSDMSEWAYNWL